MMSWRNFGFWPPFPPYFWLGSLFWPIFNTFCWPSLPLLTERHLWKPLMICFKNALNILRKIFLQYKISISPFHTSFHPWHHQSINQAIFLEELCYDFIKNKNLKREKKFTMMWINLIWGIVWVNEAEIRRGEQYIKHRFIHSQNNNQWLLTFFISIPMSCDSFYS